MKSVIRMEWKPNFFLQVSWIRKRDLHILTVGILTYTNDQRFQSLHTEGSDEWTLRITSPQPRDSGTYECQVSTEPKISQGFRLSIVGKRFYYMTWHNIKYFTNDYMPYTITIPHSIRMAHRISFQSAMSISAATVSWTHTFQIACWIEALLLSPFRCNNYFLFTFCEIYKRIVLLPFYNVLLYVNFLYVISTIINIIFEYLIYNNLSTLHLWSLKEMILLKL